MELADTLDLGNVTSVEKWKIENGKLKIKGRFAPIYTLIMENIIEKKSFDFAIRIVRLYRYLCEKKKEYVLSKQILRSGTSIGANVSEAQQAQSRADFISKISIALKETSETKYWLKLLNATDYLTDLEIKTILSDCVEIEKILTAILKSSKD